MKNIFLILIITILLFTGLYINFILQQDFLTQFGFEGYIAILCIIFFDASKVMSEILFFQVRNFITKLSVGLFAFSLIFLSIYTTFSVRTWKSQITIHESKNITLSVKEEEEKAERVKNRVKQQIESLDEQIEIKKSIIISLNKANKSKNAWLISVYNKKLDQFTKDKIKLLRELEDIEKAKKTGVHAPLTLTKAMKERLGEKGENLELATNLVIAVLTDSIILFLCFGLSFLLGQRDHFKQNTAKSKESENILPGYNSHPINLERFEKQNKIDLDESFKIKNEENILFYDEMTKKVFYPKNK